MKLKFFAYYRSMTGCKTCDISAPPTIGDLLVALSDQYGAPVREKLLSPSGTELGPDAIVLINGRNIAHLGLLNAALHDSDTVAIFPIVAGG